MKRNALVTKFDEIITKGSVPAIICEGDVEQNTVPICVFQYYIRECDWVDGEMMMSNRPLPSCKYTMLTTKPLENQFHMDVDGMRVIIDEEYYKPTPLRTEISLQDYIISHPIVDRSDDMLKLPELVRWSDEAITLEATMRITAKHKIEEFVMDLNMPALNFDELRDLATVISRLTYSQELCKRIPYEKRQIIVNKLNTEFDRRLGEEVAQVYNIIYNKFDKGYYYIRDNRHRIQLLALHGQKGRMSMMVLKNTVWFMKMKETPIDILSALELEQVMTFKLWQEFSYENSQDVQSDEGQEDNIRRRMWIEAQNDFVKYVFAGNIDEAYKMIEEDIKKRMTDIYIQQL